MNIIIPLFTRALIISVDNTAPISEAIILICYIMAFRAQLSTTLSTQLKVDVKTIQQTFSAKWSATLFASFPTIRLFLAQTVIAGTISSNLNELLALSEKDRNEKIMGLRDSLASDKPIPGSKVYGSREINSSNLTRHRYGLLNQYIGTLQARTIFDPKQVFKGVPILSISFNNLSEEIINMHEKLGIKLDPSFGDLITKENTIASNGAKGRALQEFVRTKILNQYDAENNLIFEDYLDLGTTKNLLPLEEGLPIIRTSPSPPVEVPKLSAEQAKDPLLLYAISKLEDQNKSKSSSTRKSSSLPKKPQDPPKQKRKYTRQAKKEGKN